MADRCRIGLREIRALEPGQVVWDAAVPGFGARRQRSAAVSYVLLYRTAEGRQRWHTLGRHGAPWTPDSARDEARRVLGLVVGGADPAADKKARRTAITIAELCDLYLEDAEAGRVLTRRRAAKKASTLATDKGRINGHIRPLLGAVSVRAVTREDVETFMHSVAAGKTSKTTKTANKGGLSIVRGGTGTASRTVGLLGAIFTYAVRHRLRADNPVHGVLRPADGRRERRLSETEYRAFGAALAAATQARIWPPAIAAARFLALTGWRSGEAIALRWSELDLARRTAVLTDTKSGRSVRPLPQVVCDLLRDQGRVGPLVFPPTRGEGLMTGFGSLWARIAAKSDLSKDITPHVLRHSFASLANDLGYAEPTIAVLIGHKGHSITSRYIHAADAVLLEACDAIANRTSILMRPEK